MILTKNYLERLETNEIKKLSEFVVVENFKHHSNNILPKEYKQDVKSIYKEEMNYINNSQIFVSKNDTGEIVGSIRVLKWNFMDILPIQKIFGINPLNVVGDIELNDIFHIGRFAIKKEGSDPQLFKQLMICAISPICKNKGNIVFAECDSKLLRILTLLGIKATIVGESIDYLGSETIPICMSYDGLIDFYNTNKSLVPENVIENQPIITHSLPKSVVFNTLTYNYSLV
ncbi:conserved hypothetical protein [Flavobacterium sp. 9AF]|uniref:hypothetical protein n=1 Tax=Flavobacterium sp. 9AF TaxID=2653142 RepID=UPI0012F0E540|nr:hypothetical protein [Flavobacterium sp. 9AF]VXB79161.1 conserved hypothetical protein [Flavobacterium sp. 9AF]